MPTSVKLDQATSVYLQLTYSVNPYLVTNRTTQGESRPDRIYRSWMLFTAVDGDPLGKILITRDSRRQRLQDSLNLLSIHLHDGDLFL